VVLLGLVGGDVLPHRVQEISLEVRPLGDPVIGEHGDFLGVVDIDPASQVVFHPGDGGTSPVALVHDVEGVKLAVVGVGPVNGETAAQAVPPVPLDPDGFPDEAPVNPPAIPVDDSDDSAHAVSPQAPKTRQISSRCMKFEKT